MGTDESGSACDENLRHGFTVPPICDPPEAEPESIEDSPAAIEQIRPGYHRCVGSRIEERTKCLENEILPGPRDTQESVEPVDTEAVESTDVDEDALSRRLKPEADILTDRRVVPDDLRQLPVARRPEIWPNRSAVGASRGGTTLESKRTPWKAMLGATSNRPPAGRRIPVWVPLRIARRRMSPRAPDPVHAWRAVPTAEGERSASKNRAPDRRRGGPLRQATHCAQ